MRGNPITGQARGPSIADTVARGQRILEDRPEPQGRDRYAGRTNRPPRGAAQSRPRGADAREDAGAGADGADETQET